MKKITTILALLVAMVAVQAQTATIVLNVPEVIWEGNPGYQLLLDATATQTDAFLSIGTFPCGTSYDNWSHTIPENATASNEHVVALSQASITIPAGTYDYLVVNPNCESEHQLVSISTDQCDPARGNNYTFEDGKMYTFTLSKQFNPIYMQETDCVTLTIADAPATAIATAARADFRIFPNPASQQLTVVGENIQQIEVLNLLGQSILTTSSSTIVVEDFPNGTYFVRVRLTDGLTVTKKFFKR